MQRWRLVLLNDPVRTYAGAVKNPFRELTKIAICVLHCHSMCAKRAISRLKLEDRLAGLLSHRHQTPVVFQ